MAMVNGYHQYGKPETWPEHRITDEPLFIEPWVIENFDRQDRIWGLVEVAILVLAFLAVLLFGFIL